MRMFASIVIIVLSASEANAQGVETCGRASLDGKTRSDCGGYLGYAVPAAVLPSSLVLVCPSGAARTENLNVCTAAKWKARSALVATDLIGVCGITPPPNWGACGGKEEWRLTSAVFGGTPQPPPVEPPVTGNGTMTLNWPVTTLNTDGSPLTNLTGYRIEFGPTQALGQVKDVGVVTTYTLTGLTTGTWYAGVRTLTSGIPSESQSTLSNLVSAVVTGSSPVDCVASPWSDWVPGSWSACLNGMQSRPETRVRSVVTQPINGGAACPALSETRTDTQACTSGPQWKVGPAAPGTRPVYEPVQNAASNAMVRGTVQGAISVGRPCGAERFRVGTNSYRDVAENDITLDSPTYKGRAHTAICTAQ